MVRAEHAADEVARLAHLTDDLLFLARSDAPSRVATEPTRLVPLLEHAITATRAEAERRNVRIELQGDPSLEARVAPGLVRQAAVNLLSNAIRYSPPGGTVTVRVDRCPDGALIEVGDGPELGSHGTARHRTTRADTPEKGGTLWHVGGTPGWIARKPWSNTTL
jgi:signal transduction histidine kinase